MGERRVLYAIAESCPFDSILVREMKRAVNSLLQLNLKRFRVPEKNMAKYSALDVMKQALELLYEFSPSEKNYREAMRTILVYSEGDEEMLRTLKDAFQLIANAVYNAFSGQRHIEALGPNILFLEGIPFEPTELQQSFRFVGIRPPDVSPPSAKSTIFVEEGYEPYRLVLEGKIKPKDAQAGREDYWAEKIRTSLFKSDGTALLRAGAEHLNPPKSALKRILSELHPSEPGKLPKILQRTGIEIKVTHRILDVNEVFGK